MRGGKLSTEKGRNWEMKGLGEKGEASLNYEKKKS